MAGDVKHYVWHDEPGDDRDQRALRRAACGALIRNRDRVDDPTCPKCRAERERFESLDIDDEEGA